MPTYEYRCEQGHEFEEFQSILADPVQRCPICGSPAKRMISGGTGLIFKGSGFYVTDYARKNTSGGPVSLRHHHESETPSEPAPPPSTETKTETNTAPKTDDKKSKPES